MVVKSAAPLGSWQGFLLACLLTLPTQAPAQTTPDTVSNPLLAVFGDGPLADSTLAVLRREGFRVADRSALALERARREGRRLPPAALAVMVSVQLDPSTQQHVLVAELLDVNAVERLRRAIVQWPARREFWAEPLLEALQQLFAP